MGKATVNFPGICGPANRPCKIAHSSTFANQVGVYPSTLLPATSTIWHAVFASQFSLGPPIIGIGDFPPLGGGAFPILAAAVTPTLAVTHNFQSHHYIIFARTANRVNITHTLTKDDLKQADNEFAGIAEIDIGEYVFEFVSVTDEPLDEEIINLELTDAEKEALKENEECTVGCSEESVKDKKFRNLFETPIKNNRFINIVSNTLGVEYRLDNGTDKSKLILDQEGIGDLDSPSYNDGTSRKIKVRLKGFDDNRNELPDSLVEGDKIYLTYVAVREHYLRQRVNINWTVIDPGTTGGPGGMCIGLLSSFNVAHFRFYEWDMEPEPGFPPTRLAGWRVVETFNGNPQFVAPIIDVVNNIVLANFPIGESESFAGKLFRIIPGKATPSEVQGFIDDRSSMPEIGINLDGIVSNIVFHTNAGDGDNADAFRNSNWFTRNTFTKYRQRSDAVDHIFFNIHPRALRKRDIDKFGIERFLAVEIQKDINAGKLTFFPFMDDPTLDNPTLGSNEYLDGSNSKFEPIEPVSSYGGNFEVVCGSIGSFPGNSADGINSYHSFESNKITERFELDTHILVERNFAVNAGILGPRLITIEGIAGIGRAVTCLTDPSKEFQFTGHTNNDEFLVYNFFSSGHTERAISGLSFRPDQASPPFKSNPTPTPDQFEDLVGFSGRIGDIPGINPGKALSLSAYAPNDNFLFKTTEPDVVKEKFNVRNASGIETIEIPDPNMSPLVISFGEAYCGNLVIRYTLEDKEAKSKSDKAILLIKTGSILEGSVDDVVIPLNSVSNTIQISFNWVRASSVELVGERVEYMTVKAINLTSIIHDGDFLREQDSHSVAFRNKNLVERTRNRSLFFASDIVSLSEDDRSYLYMFFNDRDGGISVASSNNYGSNWAYYYGVIEKIGNTESKNPFVVTNFNANNCFVFFQFGGKILCKVISFNLFEFQDANLIWRFEQDGFIEGTEETLPKETKSIFSDRGKLLRRSTLSYVAAGDLTDEAFLEIIGKVPGESEFEYNPFEIRNISGTELKTRKNPIARGPLTAFSNADVNDIYFSAYRKDNGELRLWFLAFTNESFNLGMLQCHFSNTNGRSWYDLWEFLENGNNRFRTDKDKNTQFIDRSALNEPPDSLFATDPQESRQAAEFGINVHWSRLKRHKILAEDGGDVTIDSESTVLRITSPYVFYQSATSRVFLFYIYESCLLCKIFDDHILGESRQLSDLRGIDGVKQIIERQTRAYFIDGSLDNVPLQEELHKFENVDTEEIMGEGNIIFKYPFAVNNFGKDRAISEQRVCALDLPTGLVRVFYKHADETTLKSALWTGSDWWAEEFLRSPNRFPDFKFNDVKEYTEVTGGFGGTGFE